MLQLQLLLWNLLMSARRRDSGHSRRILKEGPWEPAQPAPARSGKPQPGLYQGFAAYLFSQQIEQPFDDWAKGNIETLEEALR